MRKFYSLFFVFAFLGAATAHAQISVTGATGLAATYTSFTKTGGLFEALNANAQSGNAIVVTITANVTNEDGVTALSGGGWASISIKPSGARTISGAAAAGTPLISFSGADNVTIDGLNTGGNSLTISNTTASATSATSTIRFVLDATNNTITNCSVLGSFSGAIGTLGGNIYFATGTATGNDNNTISNCNIGPAGTNLPTKGIFGNGSTASTAIGNSGITINNNNIYDVFGAAVTSAGLYINGGCNSWSITNNRFYQTATRTWTTGAVHNAINIQSNAATSGAQGFTVTGNVIGYASNTQTGTYTLTGSTGKFQAIVYNGIAAAAATTISSNTIAAVSLTGVTSSGTGTSSPFAAIIIASGAVTSSSNTIGSQSATGSLTYSTNTATASDVYGIFNSGTDAWTAGSNTIGGIAVTNAGAGSFLFSVLRSNMGSTLTLTANSNTVGGTVANSISLNATGTASQVIGIQSSNAAMSATGNTVRNLTSNIGTSSGASASVIGISCASGSATSNVSQNTIYSLSNSNTTAASTVSGIHFTGNTGANMVERNFIYGLTVATSSVTAEVTGIRIGGGTTTYRNNMIALGVGISNAVQVNGINEPVLGTDNFYHNSIYIGGTPAAGTGNSFAFNSTQVTVTRNFRDNIFVNARANSGTATGKNYAIQVGGTAANPAGLTINNNLYFATGTGTVFGRFNAADVADLGAWKTAVGQDANSYQANPQFISPASATPDLHINASVVTSVEGNGVDVGVTDDFDGQARSGLTPVDIGADAGAFTGADLTGPSITYTPLNNTCTLTGVTLTATITDVSGVPTTGTGRPVLYWKVNAGAYTAVTGTFVSGNTYSFTFGSGAVGNTISYYIVAQDAAATPNVACSPAAGAAGFTATPPAAATKPTTPSSFTLQNSMGGTYTVGTTGNYATITAAVAAYNSSCLSSAVVFSLLDANYTEAAAITINANSFASAVNTLTIKPTQANTNIAVTGGSATAIFVLDGADYVIIDGSTAATANTVCPAVAATRNLTITNSNAGTSSAVVWLQTTAGADAATNNTIRNCNLVGSGNTQTLFGVGSGSATIAVTSTATGNNNNAFVNNNISKTKYGIYSGGANAGNKNTGTVINQNLINTVSPNNVAAGGILVGFENNITISGNVISEMSSAAATDLFAISVGFGISFSGATTVASEVTNATITNNIIGNVVGSGTASSLGIALSAATGGTSLIANNMVYGVISNATSPDIAAGIVSGGGAGSTTNVYHNTVAMQGTITGASAATQTSACLAVTAAAAPVLDIRNNIFTNTQVNNSGTTMRFAAIALAYSSTAGNYAGLTSNNNDLYAAGSLGTYTVGITGGITGTNRVTLANWNTETGRDAAATSKNVLPVYLSNSNLHLDNNNAGNVSNFDATAAAGTGVTADIDCATRNASTPDMGADEITAPNCTGAAGGTASGSVAFCGSGTPSITATGYSSGSTTTYQWYSSTVISDYPNGGTAVSGQTNPAALTTGTVSATTYYWLRVTCVAASVTGNSTMVTVTVNPVPAAVTVSGAGTFCTSTSITGANGNDGTIYFQGIISGGTNTSFPGTTQTVSASNTYYFRAQSSAGCWGAEGSTAVVILTAPVITPGNAVVCQNGSGSITAASTCFSAGSIQWYTTAAAGSVIGTGSPFNPVGVAGSGLANTATTGTTTYYAACSNVAACRVAVNFTINPNYTITASAGANGSISPAGVTTVTCSGTGSQSYTITPNACYKVADVLVDGVSQGAVTSYTFTNVSANHTIAASFVLNTYAITVSAGANGSITPGTGNINCGANASYTIAANSGYSIAGVTVDGVSQGVITSYTFTNVQAVHTISATFVANCINAGIGSATAGNTALCAGQTTTLTANGVAGTNAVVTWFTGPGGTGANLGTGATLTNRGAGTYYARVTANCGAPAEAGVTVTSNGNVFSGTGNWTDNARWSCGTPPASGDIITIAAGAVATLNTNFTVAGNLTMAVSGKLIVSPTSSLTVSGTADFAGQSVTFQSDNTGTASLGQVTGTLSGATNVTVERYIPKNTNKAWRVLASNTTGQTIKQAWQENQTGFNVNNNPGFGTMIPSSGASVSAVQANGFDSLSLGGSLFKYNPATDELDPVTNTNSTQLSSEHGYFIFIRGDRSANQFGSGAPTTSTVLRSTGTLFTGNQAAVTVPAGKYALVRNPYPSRLDMRQIARTGGLVDAFQVWDPKLSGAYGAGGYQTFTKNTLTGNYQVSPGAGSYGANGSVQNYIESGSAFFVQSTGSSGSVQVLESSKASGSQDVFRPSAPLSGSSRVLFNLYANNLNSTDMVDGGFVDFDDVYSNAVDVFDVRKSPNFGENFGILRSNTELVVERRKALASTDTVFFKMYQLRPISYRIDFEIPGLDTIITKAELEDKYLNTKTPLGTGSTSVSFAVDGNAASYASDRFRLLLKQSIVLPVTFISISGNRTNSGVKVDWKVAAERNVRSYTVERSNDGNSFAAAGTVTAAGNNGIDNSYSFTEAAAPAATLFYRVKSTGNAGDIKYSSIVKIGAGNVKPVYSISPNPVENGIANLQLKNQPAGRYLVRIIANNGQVLMERNILHAGGNSNQLLELPAMASGTYQVEVIAPDKTSTVQPLVVNSK